jgi:hypothetical protein
MIQLDIEGEAQRSRERGQVPERGKARGLLGSQLFARHAQRTTMASTTKEEGGTRVVCRVRPRSVAEAAHDSCVAVDGTELRVEGQSFTFDDVFDSGSTQDDLLSCVLPTLEDVVRGVNGAILAYGQSGAGKTHTMNGGGGGGGGQDDQDLGLIPRVSETAVLFRCRSLVA